MKKATQSKFMKSILLIFIVVIIMILFYNYVEHKLNKLYLNIPLDTTYQWDISASDNSDVQAIMENYGKGFIIEVSGNGEMINFLKNNEYEPIAWFQLQNMTTGWRFDLVKVLIHEGITNIGENSFAGHSSLKEVELASTIKKIGKNAFAHCDSLESVVYRGTIGQWNSIDCDVSWIDETNVKIILCTDGVVHL